MSSGNEAPVTIRRGTSEDIEAILDLLTEYGLPRSYFEPFYLNDSSYHPEQSWLVEQKGRLVSHLRIYDRWVRVGQAKLHIAGVGNVITAQDARGHGYSGQIMHAMLPVLRQEGYDYSLLWTHLPNLYSRHGWVPIEQELVRAVLPSTISSRVRIASFQDDDLAGIKRLYETTNAERTGTIIRTAEYWLEQPSWLHEVRGNFLVAHDQFEDAVVGYVRCRVMQNAVEILELGVEEDNFDSGRMLLAAASIQRDGQLQGQFPPSLRAVFRPGEFGIIPDPGLMGRAINLVNLLRLLEPRWRERIREAGSSEGAISLRTSAGRAVVQVTGGDLQVNVLSAARIQEAAPTRLSEREFAHLLFHGVDERADNIVGNQPSASFLQVIFPEQDFVIWQADAF